MHHTACVWCSKLVCVKEKPRPGHDTVCSEACKKKEIRFRLEHSDTEIGLRNYRDHGVNPNLRGKNGT